MNQLAESLSLVKFIEQHSNPTYPFQMSEQQVVSVGHQFSDCVSFLCLTTQHLLGNMARAVNCGSQKQGHTDAAFKWCGKEIALVGFGMNRMEAHFNPVSISNCTCWSTSANKCNFLATHADSKEGIKISLKVTCAGLYTLHNAVSLCDSADCGFCTQIQAQVGKDGALWRNSCYRMMQLIFTIN